MFGSPLGKLDSGRFVVRGGVVFTKGDPALAAPAAPRTGAGAGAGAGAAAGAGKGVVAGVVGTLASSVAAAASSAGAAGAGGPSGPKVYTVSTLSLDEKFARCRSVGEECVQVRDWPGSHPCACATS
jgi:hypothetical protein